MNNTTSRLGLLKPQEEDFYDVEVTNQNMDILDAKIVRLYTTETEPNDFGAFIWLQPISSSKTEQIGLLTLGESAGEGLNVVVDGATSAVTNAKAAKGDDPLSFTIL